MTFVSTASGAQPGQGLLVREVAVYRGPHLFSRTAMVRIQVDLRSLEDYPTNRLGGFADALVAQLPSLTGHGCSPLAAIHSNANALFIQKRQGLFDACDRAND
jgi:hypothetical protein